VGNAELCDQQVADYRILLIIKDNGMAEGRGMYGGDFLWGNL
jgi:hypothetical protein